MAKEVGARAPGLLALALPLALAQVLLLLLALLMVHSPQASALWYQDLSPRIYVQLGEEPVERFLGNESQVDHFRMLLRDGDSLLVGGRNVVYNLSLHDLTEYKDQRIEWESNESARDMCVLKGRSEEECQNYIRVLARGTGEGQQGQLRVCGTNAFKPLCRTYRVGVPSSPPRKEDESSGQALCPYDPANNSTALLLEEGLYVATVADFSATDPLVHRPPLRTEQYDLKHLNAPNFVSSFSHGDFVFFFFREIAVEYINCGKRVYSRVARVCRGDKGGTQRLPQRWTSFLKARLNCSVPGDFPFYFDEIQDTTNLVEGDYSGERTLLLYATFTTPANSIAGSAVCAFRLQDVLDTFEGPFKEQENMNSNWLPVPPTRVPEPPPGQCANDSRTLPDVTLNFVKSHSLMDEAVPAYIGNPLLVRTSLLYRFTRLTVDAQVPTPDGRTYDVLFIGTDDGRVLKFVHAESPALIEDIQVFERGAAVRRLEVVRQRHTAKLIVVSDGEVAGIALQRCASKGSGSCSECVALRDPYCAWDLSRKTCVAVPLTASSSSASGSSLVQNVATGEHSSCPGVVEPEPAPAPSSSPMLAPAATTNMAELVTTTPAPPITCPPCECSCTEAPPPVTSAGAGGGGIGAGEGGAQGPAAPGLPPPLPSWEQERSPVVIQVEAPPATLAPAATSRDSSFGNNAPPAPNHPPAHSPPGPKVEAAQDSQWAYSQETLAIAVSTACISALVVGFISGFLLSRRCRHEDYPSSFHETPYLEQRTHLNRLQEASLMGGEAYVPAANNKNINLVLNMAPKTLPKTANASQDTLSSKPPPHKVKKIYL